MFYMLMVLAKSAIWLIARTPSRILLNVSELEYLSAGPTPRGGPPVLLANGRCCAASKRWQQLSVKSVLETHEKESHQPIQTNAHILLLVVAGGEQDVEIDKDQANGKKQILSVLSSLQQGSQPHDLFVFGRESKQAAEWKASQSRKGKDQMCPDCLLAGEWED